jgi:two-component system alkaline phosphatase synthesis response regulator PhoP
MIVGQDDEEQVYFRTASHLAPDDFESPDAVHVMGSAFFWQREPLTPGAMVVRGYAALANRDEAMARLLVSRAEEDRLPTIPDRLPYESVAHEPPFPLQAVLRMAREDEVEGRLTTEYLLSALSRLQDEAAFPRPPAPSDNVALVADDGRHAWKLMFKHRAGSLEASVHANRTRNLFLSFGILLLLTAAVGLLYNSLRRARRLAEQQMEFVAGVSHELRTPLAVIHSAAENLADGVVQNAEQSKRYGDLIRKEGRRLTEMVEQVLELAGVQSGRRRYTFRPASVASTIERALSSCDGSLREAGFAVSKSIAPNLPETAIDDRAIQTALRNLITNAIKYSDGQTWLGIEARVEQNGKGPAIAITVRDKGRGIPAYELPFIFDRFYRGHAVREAQIHGNGLGLSLVKSTVEAHGGQVTVESEPGKGSAFTLHLPVRPVLTNEGYFVTSQGDGETGLRTALIDPFDLILLDVMLPKKSGFDVCQELRKRDVRTPILMLTARGQVVDKVVGLKIGADDYLTKPFEMPELVARIEALLRRASTPATRPIADQHQFGEVEVDFRKAEVRRAGEPIDLSAKEFQLLRYFIEHRGATLSRDELLNEVWGYNSLPSTRTIDVHVAWLRQKLEPNPRHPQYILTVHGMGYKFAE